MLASFGASGRGASGSAGPGQPAIAVPTGLNFGTVTLGDTADVTLNIGSVGNRDLVIESVDSVPGLVIDLGGMPLPLAIPVGGFLTAVIHFAPSGPLASLETLVIRSNDPLRRSTLIPLAANIRLLEVSTRIPSAQVELPLGEAATIIVTPAPSVRIERAVAHYRPGGSPYFADSVVLGPSESGADFVGYIPGKAVTERGLEYYVRVENSGYLAVDPPGAPVDSIFRKAVTRPTAVFATALSDDSGGFPEGRPTPVVVSLPRGTQFESGTLYFRLGGGVDYDSLALELTEIVPGDRLPGATIPGEFVGPWGLEFWVKILTATGTITDPDRNATLVPKTVRVLVRNLVEPRTHRRGVYRLVSIPLDLDLLPEATLNSILIEQPEFGFYDPTRWRSYRWLPERGGYRQVHPDSAADGQLRPVPGRGFWLISRESHQIDTEPVLGRSTPTDSSYRVTVSEGWNQFGNPFAFPVAWCSVRAVRPDGAAASLEAPTEWDEALGDSGAYRIEDVAVLRPFDGYWVFNPGPGSVDLLIPPEQIAVGTIVGEALAAGTGGPCPGEATPASPRLATSSGWRIQIAAACEGLLDVSNQAGVDPLGLEGPDELDRSKPPPSPGSSVSLYFVEDQPGSPLTCAMRRVDIRPLIGPDAEPALRGHRWSFDVLRAGPDPLTPETTLEFRGLDQLPSALGAWLVDRTLQKIHDLRRSPAYRFLGARAGHVSRAKDARFEFIVGTEEFLSGALGGGAHTPRETRLLTIFPNPLIEWAIVRFETAQPGPVTVAVYDVAGRRVRSLIDGTRADGIHEFAWHGDDDDGKSLPAGVYSLQLTGPDRADRRKVIRTR